MRLNAYLARAGVASRRGADELIKAGRVAVNGAPGELNTFVGSADDVRVDGRAIGTQRLRHVLLNKPRGTITTARDPQGRPTVVDLVGGEVRVVPVGRLDRDTTGVLLLTNDGALAHRLAHPRYRVEKTYVADVEGEPADDVLRRLADGVELDDGATAPRGPDAWARRGSSSCCTRVGTGRCGGCSRPSGIPSPSCAGRGTRASGPGGCGLGSGAS